MTTLELYSIYERGFIMMIKDLKKFLDSKGYTITINDSEQDEVSNYSMSFKTIYCHDYIAEPFVSQEMPEEEDAFVHYFITQCDSSFPIMKFRFTNVYDDQSENIPEIDIEVSAYLLPDNNKIRLSSTLSPYDSEKYKTTEYELNDWKKQLCILSEYIIKTIEKV